MTGGRGELAYRVDRRGMMSGMIGGGLALAGAALLPARLRAAEIDTGDLTPMTTHAIPIGAAERAARIDRAQQLMRANRIDAVLIEPGSSMVYFSGVAWWRSERLTALILPARGEATIVTPFFEQPSVRESLAIPADIRVWQEDQDPTALVADVLRARGLANGAIGIEETMRFFGSDGVARHLPHARIVSANPVVRGCRLIKTPAEIALMQTANDVTLAAMRWAAGRAKEGMTRDQVAALVVAATEKLGGEDADALILLGEASAYPHGSHKPQIVREGEVVLMDCGCKVHGYTSDISRTFVPGRAPADVRRVFDQVAEGQQVAMRTARAGIAVGAIDDAVRAYYTTLGYGPDYRLPGLSHRTGHGIGMDGHEPVNLVRGETTPLAPGMCFSNEPGLYLPGRFGVRLEDCWRMTASGPSFFTTPPTSLDRPFG